MVTTELDVLTVLPGIGVAGDRTDEADEATDAAEPAIGERALVGGLPTLFTSSSSSCSTAVTSDGFTSSVPVTDGLSSSSTPKSAEPLSSLSLPSSSIPVISWLDCIYCEMNALV